MMANNGDSYHPQMDQHASLLRILPPRPAAESIPRTHLVERLVRNDAPPIMVVQGPAGYGKSTLMQQAKTECDKRNVCTGWLTLHESDNDVVRLFRTLQILLEHLPASGGPRAQHDTPPGQIHMPDWLLGQLLTLDRNVVLFIDEFQVLIDSFSLTFFSEFFLRLPSHIRVVVSSRTVPDIGLPRLMIMEKAGLIRPADLAFTPSEVEQLFHKFDLENQQIATIYNATEGWPAAVQLYRLSLAHGDGRKSLQRNAFFQPWQLSDYLTDNVLALHPKDVQVFFLETSFLGRMCGPLCDAVTGRSDSRELLIELEKSGLFVRSLDETLEWFQYHSLFSEALKSIQRKINQAREREVHDIAARWYKERGYFEDALNHAIDNRDYALATECLGPWASQLIMDGNLTTVEKWYDRIPLTDLEQHPDLLIKMAWALAFLRRHKKLSDVITALDRMRDDAKSHARTEQDVVRAMIATLSDDIHGMNEYAQKLEKTTIDRTDEFSLFQAGATSILKGHLALFSGDFDLADELLLLGRTYGRQAKSPFTVLGSISTSAINLMIRGKLSEALELLRAAPSEAYLPLDQSVAYAAYAASFVSTLYERNELIDARNMFDRACDVILNSAQVDFLAIACVAMTRLYDSIGLSGSATSLIEDIEGIAHGNFIPRLLRLVTWEKIRRRIISGDIRQARIEANRIKTSRSQLPEGWIPFSEDTEGQIINVIRLQIHERDTDAALPLIAMEMKKATKQRRVRRQIKLLILDAMARDTAGDESRAFQSLYNALDLAQPGQYIRQFVDEGRLAVNLLRRTLQGSNPDLGGLTKIEQARMEFVRTLLAAAGVDFEHSPTGKKEPPVSSEPLSDREREIYTLLLQGLRNREIAQSLAISENTVKFHLKNLYTKLGVTTRTRAISVIGPRPLGLPESER